MFRRPCYDFQHIVAPYKLQYCCCYYCHLFIFIFLNTLANNDPQEV